MVTRLGLLTEGKAKQLYATDDPTIIWARFLDQATALNGKRKAAIPEKGALNNQISAALFTYLATIGIPSHFIQQLSETEQLIRKARMIPLEVVVRNRAAGHFESRFDVPHLLPFPRPIVEFYLKSDRLDDPFMNEDQIHALKIASAEQITAIKGMVRQVNQGLTTFFQDCHLMLVDFKVEFGLTSQGELMLADELSPDNMRLVEQGTQESLDKDLFRQQSGDLVSAYHEVLRRIQERGTTDVLS